MITQEARLKTEPRDLNLRPTNKGLAVALPCIYCMGYRVITVPLPVILHSGSCIIDILPCYSQSFYSQPRDPADTRGSGFMDFR